MEQLARERQALEVRMVEAERQAADQVRQAEHHREQLEQALNLQREAERNAALLKDRVVNFDRESEALRESTRSLKLRLDSARKLLQQASSALGVVDDATDAEIVEPSSPSSGTAKDGPPPLATPVGGAKPGMSLADLEAQAQRELRQLGSKGGSLFKGRAKN